MGKAFIIIVAVALFVYALFDVIATPKAGVKYLPKLLWIVVLLLIPIVGPLLWLIFGQSRNRPAGPPAKRRPPVRGPDDDPDWLRGL